MRSIDYEELRGDDVCSREHLSIADVLRSYPYLLTAGLIPPLAIVNALLRTGEVDAGMSGGGRWEPIEITGTEYAEIVSDLVENGTHGHTLRYVEAPDWVRDREDWSLWVAEQAYSIPLAGNRRFHALMADPGKIEDILQAGARLPVTALVDQFYADVQAMGGQRCSAPAITRLRR